ncbi:MAG TPA: glycosyltransferase family 4 protein [Spongiibacteraceae bacterium]|nr:glycosyltransferase family 4 protein [Spongiibacteraceae bacterium]
MKTSGGTSSKAVPNKVINGLSTLKIALIAPLCEAVPPRLYGGTERIVAALADALVELGHHVTLFASADARTDAKLIPVRDQAIRLDPSPLKADIAAYLSMLHEVRERAAEFDLLHFHIDLLHFPFFEHMAERTLTTMHGRLDLKDLPETFARWQEYPLISISDRQREPLPEANWLGTVYHGLCPGIYRFCAQPRGDYVAFLGRISPEKRPDRAIDIAQRAGMPLKIAAKVDASDRAYFQEKIAPLLTRPGVEFIGEIGDEQKSEFLGNARALLFPIDWPEPFGLAMIEAMACGTPVIAWNCGSVPEIVEPGITGAIVDSEAEAVAALHSIGQIDRARVRKIFERRFSALAMAARYIALYRRLLEQKEPLSALQIPAQMPLQKLPLKNSA